LKKHILRTSNGSPVLDFDSIVEDKELYFELPDKIPVESASAWKPIHLQTLNIHFPDVPLGQSVSNSPVSEAVQELVKKLELLSVSTFGEYPTAGYPPRTLSTIFFPTILHNDHTIK
jgi:hypothetical protein